MAFVRGGADKSLARPTYRCRRTESIVSLERGVCSLLVQLKDILKEKSRGEVTKGVFGLHHITPAQRVLATEKTLFYLGFQCLHHPPYSPDLAPSDYHLFPGLKKKQLKGRNFSSDAEFIAAAETWLDGQPSEFFF